MDINKIKEAIEKYSPELRIPLKVEEILDAPQSLRFKVKPLKPVLSNGRKGKMLTLNTIKRRAVDDLPVISGVQITGATSSAEGLFLTVRKDKPSFVGYATSDNGELPLFIGNDMNGNAVEIDLAKAPHLLIAGETGSGKSVCVTSIVTQLIERDPEDVRLVLIDPKRVELAQFEYVNHLACPIVTESSEAVGTLQRVYLLMEQRYTQLSEMGKRDVKDTDMPRLVVV